MNNPTELILNGFDSYGQRIRIKDVFCGGALITSEQLRQPPDGSLVGYQATFVDGDLAGRSCRVLQNSKTGAIALSWDRGLRWTRADSEEYADVMQAMTDSLSASMARYMNNRLLLDLTMSPAMQSLLMRYPLSDKVFSRWDRLKAKMDDYRRALARAIYPEAFEDEDDY